MNHSARYTLFAALTLLLGVVTRAACAAGHEALAEAATVRNQMVGTWRMVSAAIERDGGKRPAYGANPRGMLVFTADMHYVEVLTDGDIQPFASAARGQGTDDENRRAMAGSIGMFGRYTVDEQGQFTGNVVEGATFPNWVGHVRTTDDLRLRVVGDRLLEEFKRPDGTRITIEFQRVR